MSESHPNLSPNEVGRIISFLGYGNPSASVWFIGIEEGLGEATPEDAISNLKARGSFRSLMDLHEAHLLLKENGQPIEIAIKEKFTPVWVWMAKIMRARKGHRDWLDTELAKDYIRHSLGRSLGDTFLTELSPIPSKNAADKALVAELKHIRPDLPSLIRERKDSLAQLLRSASPPKLIVCYSRPRAAEFQHLLGIKWRPLTPRISEAHSPKSILLPFFGFGQIGHQDIEVLLARSVLCDPASIKASTDGYHSE